MDKSWARATRIRGQGICSLCSKTIIWDPTKKTMAGPQERLSQQVTKGVLKDKLALSYSWMHLPHESVYCVLLPFDCSSRAPLWVLCLARAWGTGRVLELASLSPCSLTKYKLHKVKKKKKATINVQGNWGIWRTNRIYREKSYRYILFSLGSWKYISHPFFMSGKNQSALK